MQTFFLKKTTLLFTSLFLMLELSSQKQPDNYFSAFEVITVHTTSLKQSVKSQRNDEKKILLNGWEITLFESGIISPKYNLRVSEGEIPKHELALAYNGYTRSGGRVSLTINDGFIYGFIRENNVVYNIEPLSYYDSHAQTDEFIIYTNESILDKTEKTCGVTEKQRVHNEMKHEHEKAGSRAGECLEIEYAIANDFPMFDKYNSAIAVENHNIAVTNDVQTNYDDEFADELQFVITEHFIVTSSSSDPFTTNTDAGALLDDFTDWANGSSGFNFGHDVGSLWTARNFAGSTVGIAWLGAICTSIRYNCLSDFTSNANFLRVMTAHELGHNFDASHDASGSPHIMAPSVQNTNTWSTASITDIQNFYNSINCLDNCSSGIVLEAIFEYDIIEECTIGEIDFTNTSVGNITNWFWEFEGGIPATSTQQNPTVTYPQAGVFTVSLTVSNNNNSNTLTLNNEIEILPTPQADLDYSIDGSEVSFTNLSITGGFSSTFWDFGDGTGSTDENPIHTYAEDGSYTVVLIIENECGVSQVQTTVVIATPPVANFTSNVNLGCSPLSVQFFNNSTSNSQSFLWNFPGGSPLTSTLQNPIVNYSTPGSYDVTLAVTNPQGNDELAKTAFINVSANSTAGFNYLSSGTTFNFTNTSSNATTYSWNFGDGNTSTEINPSHTYANTGTYTITLISDNPICDADTISQIVNATSAPVSSFTVNSNTGCEVFTAQFTNLSQNNPTSFNWTFEGGNPATSAEQNPVVVYTDAGNYDVQLITTNAFGNDTLSLSNYVTVNTIPSPSFTQSSTELIFSFQNTSIGATAFTWNFGDGNTSTEENPTHTYAQEGSYNVSFTATNDCGDVSIPANAIAALSPQASFSSDVNNICPQEQVQFTDSSTGFGITRLWTFIGGSPAQSTDANPLVTYATPGTYDVTLTVTNSTGNSTTTVVNAITVKTLPTSFFTEQVNGLEISATNASQNAQSYLWTLPDGTISSSENVNYTASQNGNYSFVLVATNECGTSTYAVVVNLNSLPVAEFASDISNLGSCSPISVQYNLLPNTGASYNWTFEGGNPATSTDANPLVVYQDSGSFDVTLIVTNALGSDTTNFDNYANLNNEATANYSYVANEGTVNFTYTGEDSATLNWDFAGQGTSIEINPQFTFTNSGTYPVTLITENPCGKDTIIQNVEVIISSIENIEISSIKFYPNPVNDILILESNSLITSEIKISVIDVLGRNVGNHRWNIGTKTYSVPTEKLTSGAYLIKVSNGQKTETYKIVKE